MSFGSTWGLSTTTFSCRPDAGWHILAARFARLFCLSDPLSVAPVKVNSKKKKKKSDGGSEGCVCWWDSRGSPVGGGCRGGPCSLYLIARIGIGVARGTWDSAWPGACRKHFGLDTRWSLVSVSPPCNTSTLLKKNVETLEQPTFCSHPSPENENLFGQDSRTNKERAQPSQSAMDRQSAMSAPPQKPHNLFQVYLRLRPAAQGTSSGERFLAVEDPEPEQSAPSHITLNPPNDRRRAIERFAFTQVFEEEASQLDVFHCTNVASLVEGVLAPHGGEGTDALLATLGVTGSGKVCWVLASVLLFDR